MRHIIAGSVLVALCSFGVFPQEPHPAQPSQPMAPLAWLVGGIWTADASQMGGGMQRIETRYEWSDNRAFLRFHTHFVSDKGTLHNYDGQFFWDPRQQALKMWYMNARNDITEGSIRINDNEFTFLFQGTDFEEKPAELRVQLTRKNNDRYLWQLAEKTPHGWNPLASLEYVRR
jgi:hypothetical protein